MSVSSAVLHLRLAGVLLILLALMHLFLPERFAWRQELARLSLLNRQIFCVHTFFICVVLVMMGLLSILAAPSLVDGSLLARLVVAGLAAFWLLRLVFQFFVFSPQLWRGHRFNTLMHGVFTALWVYLTCVYAAAFWVQRRPLRAIPVPGKVAARLF